MEKLTCTVASLVHDSDVFIMSVFKPKQEILAGKYLENGNYSILILESDVRIQVKEIFISTTAINLKRFFQGIAYI